MADDTDIPRTFERLAVFPLPGTVLFPGTVLPLHIFEPRYRQMIADIVEEDQWLGIVMLQEDADPLDERPAVYDVACAGKLIHSERLDDGRYNVLVQGMARAKLTEEVEHHQPYRRFRARCLPEVGPDAMEAASLELGRLQSCVLSLTSLVEHKDAELVEVLRATPDPLKLADILGAAVVSDPQLQQALLSTADLRHRLSMLIDGLAEVMVRVGDPPDRANLN